MSERVRDECCNVSLNNYDCEAPAGYQAEASLLRTCFQCGNDVCRKCSGVILHRSVGAARHRRICNDCQEELRKDAEVEAHHEHERRMGR